MGDFRLEESCGLFGCIAVGNSQLDKTDIGRLIYLGLTGLQHRGQESAGIVTSHGDNHEKFAIERGEGLVYNVFKEENMKKLIGDTGIGHVRYSTAGGHDYENIQPFVVHNTLGRVAVAHNGQLTNSDKLRRVLMNNGVGLSTSSDSEIIIQLLSKKPNDETHSPDWLSRMKYFMGETQLAYSILILHKDKIYAVRDPFGNRPLCLGTKVTDETSMWLVSSESCCFASMKAKYERDVEPGEIVELSKKGIRTLDVIDRPNDALCSKSAFCIFEYVYFSRQDSRIGEMEVYQVRKRCGEILAEEHPVDADLVSRVPESATPAAIGYANRSKIRYDDVLCKNNYIGRTFIQPTEELRKSGVTKKFGVMPKTVCDKRVILVDDSLVRGTTLIPIIKMLREAGALQVHIRVASPMIKNPCYMGINIPSRSELIANKCKDNAKEISKVLGADSVYYLSVDGLKKACRNESRESKQGYCTGCLDGNYPIEFDF